MASSWRPPYPKQQNPGLAYQERPAMPECSDHPNPSPRLTNRPPFPYVPQGGAPIEAHWYQYTPMTSPETYMPPLMQPPLMNIPPWIPINPFSPVDNSQRAMPEDQPRFEIPGQRMTTTECGMTAIGRLADQTIFNQPRSVTNVYDVAQPGPSHMMNPWEMRPDGVMPSTSQCMVSAVLGSRPTARPPPAGRRIPVPQGPNPQAIMCTPAPQKPLSQATRVLLQCQYYVWPEAVEGHLHELQNKTPTTKRYKQLVDDLHTQLYDVPATFYHRLVCSFPLELRHSLHKLRHYTY
ncbi:hypothetical protein ABVT39_017328 [Epinephelus coioides]